MLAGEKHLHTARLAVLEGRVAYTIVTPLKAVKDEGRRKELLQQAIEEELTREQVKRLVAEANEPPVSIRDLEGRMKPARSLVSASQLRKLPPAKRRDFVKLVEEFVSRAGVLLGDMHEKSEA